MRRNYLACTTVGALLALGGAAFAQTPVTATTDLNVRAGPGPQYPVVGVIGASQSTTLNGCLQDSKWCSVATQGGEGWVYADYLTGDFGGTTVVLSERPATSEVTVVEAPAGNG
ncbi:MAG: SH3 domain-containing protein, partial [Pseudaminobacter sp.]